LQAKIIHLIHGISDINRLQEIHTDVQSKLDVAANKDLKKLPWNDSIVEMKERITFDDLVKEQGEKSLSFEELRSLADEIEWNCTLDEILEILD
ncbi:MAG: hypothetical protein AAGJ93_04495, partial [Bacteroidota bacterium]